ncbi:MAG: nucleotidyl transferase AbiEii/AbiGii toxin family protein [bacterium]
MKDRNMPHSVATRLLNLARKGGENYEYILLRYGAERLLYRLSRSDAADRFLLKGASLFLIWNGCHYRPTRDIDLLGYGSPDPARLIEFFCALCKEDRSHEDGLVFLPESVLSERIKEGQEYEGVRICLRALLQNARIDLQIDIGFGDLVVPAPTMADFPVLLDAPVPRIRIYPKETAFAEKLQTLVARGLANSRLKDYLDLWVLSMSDIDKTSLKQAIRSTFSHRGTDIPRELPPGLSLTFAQNPARVKQWSALLQRVNKENHDASLERVISDLVHYVSPLFASILNNH